MSHHGPYLYISVYSHQAHHVAAPLEPAIAEWVLSIEDEPNESPAFPEFVQFVMLIATDNCLVDFGKGGKPIYAGERLFFGVHEGKTLTVRANG